MRTREGKLVDAGFVRSLSDRERAKMEGHLVACGHCQERYRKMQLAERVLVFGPDGDLDAPAQLQIERMAEAIGLVEAPPRRFSFLDVRIFGGAASLALAVALAAIFLKPPDDGLVARGGGAAPVTFSTYAVKRGAPIRLLDDGALVSPEEHLKLRATWRGTPSNGVDVVLVASDGAVEHVRLDAPDSTKTTVTIPGAIALADLPEGRLVTYVISAPAFDLERIRSVVSRRGPPEDVAAALDDATVERLDLVVGGATE